MDKPALDATCGSRMMWFDKHDSRCLYVIGGFEIRDVLRNIEAEKQKREEETMFPYDEGKRMQNGNTAGGCVDNDCTICAAPFPKNTTLCDSAGKTPCVALYMREINLITAEIDATLGGVERFLIGTGSTEKPADAPTCFMEDSSQLKAELASIAERLTTVRRALEGEG